MNDSGPGPETAKSNFYRCAKGKHHDHGIAEIPSGIAFH